MQFFFALLALVAAVSAQSTITASAACPTGPAADQMVTRTDMVNSESTPCPTLVYVYSNSTAPHAASSSTASRAPVPTAAANHVNAGSIFGVVAAAAVAVAGLLV